MITRILIDLCILRKTLWIKMSVSLLYSVPIYQSCCMWFKQPREKPLVGIVISAYKCVEFINAIGCLLSSIYFAPSFNSCGCRINSSRKYRFSLLSWIVPTGMFLFLPLVIVVPCELFLNLFPTPVIPSKLNPSEIK